MSQGQGNGTAAKEKYIAACLRQSLRISLCARWRQYVHLEITSGSGWNEKARCLGSPVEFAKLAVGMRRRARMVCCDINPESADTLLATLSRFDGLASEVCCEDNATFLPRVSALLPAGCFGTLVCDPNGPTAFPREQLLAFAGAHPQIDLVMTFNANFYRSIDPQRKKGERAELVERQLGTMYDRYGTVRESIEVMPREDWWISNPTAHSGAGNSYVVALGRSMPVRERPCKGFFRLGSDEGAEIIDSLSAYHGQLTFRFPNPL